MSKSSPKGFTLIDPRLRGDDKQFRQGFTLIDPGHGFRDDVKAEGSAPPSLGSSGGRSRKAGFTLIELLVVIAIIAVLAVVVVVVLNPAELLKQSRDSNRVSDMATLKSAISLYMVDASNINLASSSGAYGNCYLSTVSGNGTTTAKCGVFLASYTANASTTSVLYRNKDSTGWLPVNFSQISYGSPLNNLPIDPLNTATNYYAYAATTTGGYYFELAAWIESAKYRTGASSIVTTSSIYEAGTDPGLAL